MLIKLGKSTRQSLDGEQSREVYWNCWYLVLSCGALKMTGEETEVSQTARQKWRRLLVAVEEGNGKRALKSHKRA